MPDALTPDQLLALAFDQAPHAIVVVSASWQVEHWGQAAERLFGWTAAEAQGESFDQLTAPGGADASQRLPGPGQTSGADAHAIVMRRHKDGHLMHIEVSWRPMRDDSGAIRSHVLSNRDVSGEQLRSDVALINERYQDLLDSVPDAIVVANDVGAIVLFNAEASRLFGVGSDAMIGAPVERLIPERFARGHGRHRERFASQPQRRPMGSGLELRGVRGDGSEFPVEVSLSPLPLGQRLFAMAALRDLSERVRLEEAQQAATTALRANTAKTEFLSRMSHELRTPLNAILGFGQVLGADPLGRLDATQHRQIAQILRAGRHLLAMMNDLLDVTRIETGALSLSMEPVALEGMLEEVMALCEPAADSGSVQLDFHVDPPELCAWADRLRLRQVLLNIITNAIKYNRAAGRVDVHAQMRGAEVCIAVRDTGIGLSSQQLSRLYRPFDRLGAEAGGIEGTGIGLVIARGLVQGMGGRIDVESQVGTGSVFSIHLQTATTPLSQAARQLDGAAQQDAGGARSSRCRQLLYIEDNEANIEVMEAVMKLRPAWQLSVARSGAEALSQTARTVFDLMIVDMHLADTDGLELARHWDSGPRTARIPRVALSADATEARRHAAANRGFLRYFTKPLDLDDFLGWMDGFSDQGAGSTGSSTLPMAS